MEGGSEEEECVVMAEHEGTERHARVANLKKWERLKAYKPS